MIKKILLLLLILSIIVIPLTGCWNYVEVDKVSIVSGIAIDQGTGENSIELTTEIVNASSGGKDSKISSEIVESKGASVSDAIGNALRVSAKRLYIEHCQVIIISQQIAQSGINPVLDYFLRDHEPRLGLNIVISKEKTAKEILTQKTVASPLVGFEINQEMESDHRDLSKTRYIKLYQIYDELVSKGVALTLPIVENVENNGVLTSSLDGIAIFDNDKMIGMLDENDSQLLNFALDEVTGGTEIVVDETDQKPLVTLEVFKDQTKTVPNLTGGNIKLTINNILSVAIDEINVDTDYVSKKGLDQLTNMAQEQMDKELSAFIKKIQTKYGVDIFGFGELIHQTNPKLWAKIKPHWKQIFRSLDVTVTTKVNIRSSYIIKQPIKKGE